jgi:hypothetical protein
MVILRATQKLLHNWPELGSGAGLSDTALGDWYLNRLVVDRQPLLIMVSSRSLLSILAPARDVRALPTRLPNLVADRLRRLGVPEWLAKAESAAMNPVVIARTQDRSILGTMVDFAKMIPGYLPIGGWDQTTLPFVEARLAETPCRASGRLEE